MGTVSAPTASTGLSVMDHRNAMHASKKIYLKSLHQFSNKDVLFQTMLSGEKLKASQLFVLMTTAFGKAVLKNMS